MEFPVIVVIELVDAYHGSQAGERQMADEYALIPVSLGYAFEDFLAFFPKNLLYWNRKFNEIQLYIVFSEFQALVFGGILCLFIPLNLWLIS